MQDTQIHFCLNSTTICFDFGNTRLKYGVFDGDALIHSGSLSHESVHDSLREVLEKYTPGDTLLSSVISHDREIEDLLTAKSRFILLNEQTKIPFTTPVAKPATIGADRLALMAYAAVNFPAKNVLVIALGSCITYNFLNKYGSFLGGGISPGMDMRLKSLHDLTANLPLVKVNWNFPLVGYDTRTNILSGVLLGMACEIDGIIDKYREKYLNFNVHLTGGNCADFVPHLKNKIFADPSLILKGLYAISKFNHEDTP